MQRTCDAFFVFRFFLFRLPKTSIKNRPLINNTTNSHSVVYVEKHIVHEFIEKEEEEDDEETQKNSPRHRESS